MKKIIIPVLAATAAICILFAGCGNKDNGTTSSTSSTSRDDLSSSSSSSAATSSTAADIMDSSESMFNAEDGRVSDTTAR